VSTIDTVIHRIEACLGLVVIGALVAIVYHDRMQSPQPDPALTPLSAEFANFKSDFEDLSASQQMFRQSVLHKADKLQRTVATVQQQVGVALNKMNTPAVYKPLAMPAPDQVADALKRLRSDPLEQKCVLHGAMTEVSNQDDVGVANYFQVVVNRMAVNRPDWGGKNACGVVHQINRDKNTGKMVRQFSGVTVSEVNWNPGETSDLLRMKELLRLYLAGELKVPEAYLRSDSYMNPCTADKSNVRDWRKSLLFDGRHEDHDFYHTPSLQEIGMLRGQIIPVPVCRAGHGHVRLMARGHHYRHRYHHKRHAPTVAQNAQPGLLARLFGSATTAKTK